MPFCWLLWRHGGEELLWGLTLAALQAHGPLAVKFSQWASTRPDLLPRSVCDRLASLQSDCQIHSYDSTIKILAEAFGPGWHNELACEPVPIGSGCMAQVYRGRLRAGPRRGEDAAHHQEQDVAIKVRHPGAHEKVDLDLEVMWTLVRFIEFLWPAAKYLALSDAVGHFEAFVRPQADLRVEASNLELFRRNFEYARTGKGLRVRFPEVMWPYVSESVLVESYEHATPLQAVLGQTSAHISKASSNFGNQMLVADVRDSVGKLCMDVFLKMLFADNFIHGDMHPGNIHFRFPDADGARNIGKPELILLDAGLAVELKPGDRRNFVELFHALVTHDGHRAGNLMIERSPGDRALVIDEAGFVKGIEDLVGQVREGGIALGRIRMGDLFGTLLSLALEHRVRLETVFVKTVTSIIVLEGVGRQLSPVVDLMLAARPLLAEAVTQRLW